MLDWLPSPSWYVLLGLGLLLLANPVYAYPGGVYGTYHYEAEQIGTDDEVDVARVLSKAGNVVVCDRDRECVGEREIQDAGELTVETRPGPIVPNRYDVVLMDGQFYRTESTSEDGETTYSLEPVAPRRALEIAAVETGWLGEASAGATRAVEHRDVYTDGRIVESYRRLVVRHDGDYYTVQSRRGSSGGTVRPGGLLVRIVGFAFGSLCLVAGGWRYGRDA